MRVRASFTWRRVLVGLIVFILIASAILFYPKKAVGYEKATLDDLLKSTSERNEFNGSVLVSDSSPYYVLIATPLSVYYDDKGKHAYPLLVSKDTPSTPVQRFLEIYGSNNTAAIALPSMNADISFSDLSTEIALYFWARSDGALLIEKSKEGYECGVVATSLASYVNIPVIVTEKIDSTIEKTLKKLKVKYSIVCGKLNGYKKTMKLSTMEEINDIAIPFVKHPDGLNGNISYIAMANPLDVYYPQTINKIKQNFEGDVFHFEGEAGVWPGTTASSKGVDFEVNVPEDFKIGLMRFTLKFRPHEQVHVDGERIYAFIYAEQNGEFVEKTFFGTPAGRLEGGYAIVDFEYPLINETGKHLIHVEGRMTYEGVPVKGINEKPVHFYLDVEIVKLSNPLYPLMPSISSLAPYLTAYRMGVVMAKGNYALQHPGYTGCAECGEPSSNENAIASANNQSLYVHSELLSLLFKIRGEEMGNKSKEKMNSLAEYYYNNPLYIGIIADTNMIPHYYYPGGEILEGIGEPGDTIYADINVDYTNPQMDLGEGKIHPKYPDVELPVGRIVGWDVQDVSALLARTFFYNDIIDKFRGYNGGDILWKNNAYAFLGSRIPVETMYPSLFNTMVEYAKDGGFNVKQTSEIQSHRINSDKFQMGSNFIVGGVHGFYYWYVPSARGRVAGGSAYDVLHVRDMNFGPSVFFLVSCVTGRIDGILPQNSLAMAYMHGGVNAYIGATRSTVGWIDYGSDVDMRLDSEGAPLLGEKFTSALIKEDKTTGIALRDAKNKYLPEDSEGGAGNNIDPEWSLIVYEHYVLHGDPMFNPYEPVN